MSETNVIVSEEQKREIKETIDRHRSIDIGEVPSLLKFDVSGKQEKEL